MTEDTEDAALVGVRVPLSDLSSTCWVGAGVGTAVGSLEPSAEVWKGSRSVRGRALHHVLPQVPDRRQSADVCQQS